MCFFLGAKIFYSEIPLEDHSFLTPYDPSHSHMDTLILITGAKKKGGEKKMCDLV